MNTSKAWLIAAAVCIIVEILPPPTHFFFLCVAIGALAASIAAFFSAAVWLPWVVFAVVSVALTPMLIPLAKFLFTPKNHPSNVDAIVGEKALVLEEIHAKSAGVVKVKGETWSARSEAGDTFVKDSWVQIIKVEGTHVVVKGAS
jgi:membrane protein implicated in regulation of membrane protease activity